jgi:hypothetical protein
MKLISYSLIESIKKIVLSILPIKVINSKNRKIINKKIYQNGEKNIFVGGDFNTNKYKLQVRGALTNKEKGTVKMELYKVYENGESELVINPYWSMYVPGTRGYLSHTGGWLYDYQKRQDITWSKNDSPFTEVAVSLYDRDRNHPEDIANFSCDNFLALFKNEG